jgi:hypothetical protein
MAGEKRGITVAGRLARLTVDGVLIVAGEAHVFPSYEQAASTFELILEKKSAKTLDRTRVRD